jgi:hypothetical protein
LHQLVEIRRQDLLQFLCTDLLTFQDLISFPKGFLSHCKQRNYIAPEKNLTHSHVATSLI